MGILRQEALLESAAYRALLLIHPTCYSGCTVLSDYLPLGWGDILVTAVFFQQFCLSPSSLTGSQPPRSNTRKPGLCLPSYLTPKRTYLSFFPIIYWGAFESFIKIAILSYLLLHNLCWVTNFVFLCFIKKNLLNPKITFLILPFLKYCGIFWNENKQQTSKI